MLSEIDAVPNLAVKDMSVARRFYEGTLGFTKSGGQEPEMIEYKSGKTSINVYRSDFAGTNKATAVTWEVPDVEKVVSALKAKGVKFEHYDDMDGMTLKGDVHVAGDMKIAWFKDPDGNILNLVGG
jgi:catechol 2,3-dioxygenase-like lactoylglutathione lyase family enzyme